LLNFSTWFKLLTLLTLLTSLKTITKIFVKLNCVVFEYMSNTQIHNIIFSFKMYSFFILGAISAIICDACLYLICPSNQRQSHVCKKVSIFTVNLKISVWPRNWNTGKSFLVAHLDRQGKHYSNIQNFKFVRFVLFEMCRWASEWYLAYIILYSTYSL